MKLLVTFVSLFLIQTGLFVNGYPCPLEWEKSILGSFSTSQAIESSPGEYIARVLTISDDWVIAPWNPTLGSHNHQVLESEGRDYEILTNPNNCIVKWVSSARVQPGTPPEGAVTVAPGQSKYIGRGKINTKEILGTSSLHNLTIILNGHETHLRSYQYLSSNYPLLHGRVIAFSFNEEDILNVYTNASVLEVIESSTVQAMLTGTVMDSESISHARTITESFVLEDEYEWEGFSSLDISLPLWFGPSDLKKSVQLDGTRLIKLERSRDLTFSKTVQVLTARNMQICSTFLKPRSTAFVGFTATVEIAEEEMSFEQINTILRLSGRTILDDYTGAAARPIEIKGKMTGRYAMELCSFEFPIDAGVNKPGKCLRDLHGKPRP
ncbi:unnamed protein product [Allacma fusca]|uniref:Uncharacterized protein n=1 Tax=Allacma fusca TaxID=39272 RepID=A0A8J2PLX3_9HEXA|nr:unnamed protein product [Allacma fusca]